MERSSADFRLVADAAAYDGSLFSARWIASSSVIVTGWLEADAAWGDSLRCALPEAVEAARIIRTRLAPGGSCHVVAFSGPARICCLIVIVSIRIEP